MSQATQEIAAADAERLLREIGEVSAEIDKLEEAVSALRTYRTVLCARARKVGVSVRRLGAVAGVSGVAVTQWLRVQGWREHP